MPTNKQRRDAARRHLERQLQRRQEREAVRKRRTLIATIAGTVVLAAVIVIFVVAVTGDDKKKPAAKDSSTTPTAPTSASSPSPTPSTSYPPAKGASVSFSGVTVKGAADLKGKPGVTSKSSKPPAKLEYKDLVVGKGEAATPTSTVTVQYVGALYKNGTEFDSSWKHGQPAQFSLTPGSVIDGFTQGIGGTKGVPPMKVGGRRIIIMPSSLGYKDRAQGPIPANSPLVFVVDLKAVTEAPPSG